MIGMRVTILDGVRSVDRDEWNGLVGDTSPFLDWDWLTTLEDAECVGGRTGWRAQPLTARDDTGRLVGIAPLYVKAHSMG